MLLITGSLFINMQQILQCLKEDYDITVLFTRGCPIILIYAYHW